MARRFVHIYNDPEIPGVRFISDHDHDSAETEPAIDSDLIIETVELLTVTNGKTDVDRADEEIRRVTRENHELKEENDRLYFCLSEMERRP